MVNTRLLGSVFWLVNSCLPGRWNGFLMVVYRVSFIGAVSWQLALMNRIFATDLYNNPSQVNNQLSSNFIGVYR